MGVIAKALEILLPRGIAWALLGYGAALKAGIAIGLDRVYQAALEIIKESTPGRATILLPDWHSALGLRYEATKPLAEQRAMLDAEWTSLGGMTLNDLQRQIQKEFPGITIAEVSASSECGVGECGVAICGAGDGVYSTIYFDVLGEVQNDSELMRVGTICAHYAAAHLIPCLFAINVLSVTATSSECGDCICGLGVAEGESGPLIPSFESAAFAAGVGQPGARLIAYPGEVIGGPTPVLTYQWRYEGADIDGATSRFYTLPTDLEEAGDYDCVVTAANATGSDTSTTNAITLAGIAPVIESVTLNYGGPVILPSPYGSSYFISAAVIATGDPVPTITYQWYKDGVIFTGQTSRWLYSSVPGATAGSEYTCEVTATNIEGSATMLSDGYTPDVF